MPSLLQRAVLELGIDVPVGRVDLDEQTQTVILHLVGHHEPVRWMATQCDSPAVGESPNEVGTHLEPVEPPADDLTLIPGIGAKTADTLHQAGYHTFTDLQTADDHALKDLVGGYTLAKIREYLYVHYS